MSTIILEKYDTYLASIENSIGSNLFRNVYSTKDGVPHTDILKDGDLSCAFFVSCLLVLVGYITKPHATVSGLTKELERTGWVQTSSPKKGDIVVWQPRIVSEEMHPHIGFYIGDNYAVSNSSEKKSPQKHHITNWVRPDQSTHQEVTAIYTHPEYIQ